MKKKTPIAKIEFISIGMSKRQEKKVKKAFEDEVQKRFKKGNSDGKN
jgi:hypothetical protein